MLKMYAVELVDHPEDVALIKQTIGRSAVLPADAASQGSSPSQKVTKCHTQNVYFILRSEA